MLWAGSTSWDAAFRQRCAFYQPKEEETDDPNPLLDRKRVFSIEKSNYGPQGLTIDCELHEGAYRPSYKPSGTVA